MAGLVLAFQSLIAHAAEDVTGKPVDPQAKPAIELGAPFRDGAILQREKPVPVWGWAEPGSKITVEFAGQKKMATVGKDGLWMVRLDPMPASAEPRTMTIASSLDNPSTPTGSAGTSHQSTIGNILVGEVWHASGQSNMEWAANKSMCSGLASEMAKSKDEIPIRELRTDTVSALYPQKRATSVDGWKSSRAAGDFSALALSFAYEIYKELKVPVGILLTSHSNTRIETFTQREAIEAHPSLKMDVDLMHDGDVSIEQGRAAFEKYYQDLAAWQKASAELGFPAEKPLPRPSLPGIAGQWRGPSQFFNGKIAPVVPYAIRGSLWCQGESNNGDGSLYAPRMEALVNGWRTAWDMPEMPFYFTQMQCYGAPDPDSLGMAEVRQAQHLFFVNNRKHIGMVVQTDVNSASPGGIHYHNKLHPGMRLARWALANEYGRDIAYTGPIYTGYRIEGNKAVVLFDKDSLFGGLMVGSKGIAEKGDPDKFVEPALPTPGVKLNQFRMCGKDRKWHAADAEILGNTVVVTSKDVPEPVGVQYAYNAVPVNANLYNKAGLPATPFAAIDGKLIFEENNKRSKTEPNAGEDGATPPARPFLAVANYYRDGVIIQRDKPVHVWGYANTGVAVTVKLGDAVQTAKAGGNEAWSVAFPPMKASAKPITLSVETDNGQSRRVANILVGDVWYLTGSTLLTSEWGIDRRDKQATVPEAMPLVREFKRNTKSSSNPIPRKRYFETGGDRKYRSFWLTADYTAEEGGVTMFAYQFAKALNRPGIPQGFITMSSGGKGDMASLLSWTSYAGIKDVTDPAFRARLDALRLSDPASDVAKKAVSEYVAAVKACVGKIVDMAKKGEDMSAAPLQFPAFPEPGRGGDVPADSIPTLAYNWCVSPLTPMAVAGVIWIPGESNIGYKPADYAAELEIYARSLPATYGQDKVQFLYAQPSATLVKDITAPSIAGAKSVTLDKWPRSLKAIAAEMGKLAE